VLYEQYIQTGVDNRQEFVSATEKRGAIFTAVRNAWRLPKREQDAGLISDKWRSKLHL